jgi:hypothetical protein
LKTCSYFEKGFVSGHRFSDADKGSRDKRLQPLGLTAGQRLKPIPNGILSRHA